MQKNIWIGVIIIILLAFWALFGSKQPATNFQQGPQPFAISINELNKSGQSGTAVLKEINGKANVVITLNGQPKDIQEPSQIRAGSCDKPGDVKYTLNPVRNGSSITTLNVSLNQLTSELPLLIDVHKSEKETITVACGDIVLPSPYAPATP